MQLQFIAKNLKSTIVRQNIGKRGTRVIAKNGYKEQSDGDGNIISKVYSAFSGFAGWLSEKLDNIVRKIDLKQIWTAIVAGFHILWTFNWQVPDDDIDKQIQAQWQTVSERAFGVLGRAFGHLVCGFVPGIAIATVNEPLAAAVLKAVGEEAIRDLSYEMSNFLSLMTQTILNHAALELFKNVRKLIKRAVKNPVIRSALSAFMDVSIIDRWGEERGKEWSFASAFQKLREKLPIPWQNRVEEFVDEFSDACIEAGYVVAGSIDEFYGLNSLGSSDLNPLGYERTTFFYPDRDVESEYFLLKGKEETVKSQMIEILNERQIIDNREIAINFPTEEYSKVPITENNGIEVMFEFYKYEEPPYWTKERRKDNGRQRITVTNVNRNSLRYDFIKNVWQASFIHGKVKTTVYWDNGRKSQIYAKSEKEGEQIAERLAKFTDAEIVQTAASLMPQRRKERNRVTEASTWHKQYLARIHVTNWEKLTKYEEFNGKIIDENKKNFKRKFDMHYEREPSWWQKEMSDLLKRN